MPRNMSFMLTTDQIRDRTKTVTRRIGWGFLKPGDLIWACEKCQGLKKGEKIKRLALLRVVSAEREPLHSILGTDDAEREGFPDMGPADFMQFFCREMGVSPSTTVTRIEFEYVEADDE